MHVELDHMDAAEQKQKAADGDVSLNNAPSRHLSDGFVGGKACSRMRRPSLSDVPDEFSVNQLEEPNECDLTMPYSEIVTIPGVSDVPQLHGCDCEELPPPPSMGRSRKRTRKKKPNAVISLISPHKLLIVSEDLCALFRYTVESEISGRAVKLLQGPRTDPTLIVAGIKGSALGASMVKNVILYDREGNAMELEASFSPYQSGDESLAGCLLELNQIEGATAMDVDDAKGC
jgi:hypothetical protein